MMQWKKPKSTTYLWLLNSSSITCPVFPGSHPVSAMEDGVTLKNLSSGRLLMLLCAVCAFSVLLVLTIFALAGCFSSKDIPVPSRIEPCPMNWLHSRNKCYYYSSMYKEEGDWDESQRFCSSHNGSLALFDNEEQLNFLMDISSGHHMWVGLRKRQDGIHWANGTACSSSLCSITDFGECAFIALRALYMSSCGLPRPYICSKEPYVWTSCEALRMVQIPVSATLYILYLCMTREETILCVDIVLAKLTSVPRNLIAAGGCTDFSRAKGNQNHQLPSPERTRQLRTCSVTSRPTLWHHSVLG